MEAIMKNIKTLMILYTLSCLSSSLSHAHPVFAEEVQEEQHAWRIVAEASRFAVSGAHGTFSGGDPYHAPLEDMHRYTTYQSVETHKRVSKNEEGVSFFEISVKATEIAVRSAYGVSTGTGLIESALEDIKEYSSSAPLLKKERHITDQERLEELERETKALRSKLEEQAADEPEESGWWKRIKNTFSAVKETVGIVGVVLGIVVAVIALI